MLLWSNMFQPGRAFQMYTAHLAKATILLKQPTDWKCPDIKSVMRGLKNAHDLSFRFENFLFAGDLLRLIRATKLTSEFGCAAFFSFLFLLRVPSETLSIRKATPEDRITDLAPPKSQDPDGGPHFRRARYVDRQVFAAQEHQTRMHFTKTLLL